MTDYVLGVVASIGRDILGAGKIVFVPSGKIPPVETFTMRAFYPETALLMAKFINGDRSTPSIYRMFDELAELQGLHVEKIELYTRNDDIVRGDITLTGKNKNVVLRGYWASDAIALALYYVSPVFIDKQLFSPLAVNQ